jgi:DNA-binding MarR family transcriptional regulator
MSSKNLPKAEDCNCFAVRSAARHVSQFYDRFLAPTGLRTTQFSILAKLNRKGPLTINELAKDMIMDRTTLGRNVRPLERDGLIAIEAVQSDRALLAGGRSLYVAMGGSGDALAAALTYSDVR